MTNIHRRAFLAATASGIAIAALPWGQKAKAADNLTVATYGGYFQDTFDKEIFPVFTKETGIAVNSIPTPTSEAWVTQLEQAARADQALADVSMISQVGMLRGQPTNLWQALDESKIPNLKYLPAHHQHRYADGKLDGVGAVSWYITLVTNTKVYPTAPTSWTELWNSNNKDKIGLLSQPGNSFLLEVTARTHFANDKDMLKTQDGVLTAMRKLAEVKPNVRLWYRDEGQFQQALEAGEIPMGQYYHDVTGLSAAEGNPVRSTFPKEGGILDSGCWAITRTSKKAEAAHVFIDFMSRPATQDLVARKLGTAPTVAREHLTLTAEEFASVSSDIPPIIPEYRLYSEWGDWTSQKWSEMITG